MLTIDKDGTFATLHRSVSFAQAGVTDLGTITIAALTADEQAALADYNQRRATISIPASYPDQVIDEYAQELVRQWAAAVANGTAIYSDPSDEASELYIRESGALFPVTADVSSIATIQSDWLSANNGFFSERTNCPENNWMVCPYLSDTGHYIDSSRTDGVFVGMSSSAPHPVPIFESQGISNSFAYGALIILNRQQGQGYSAYP
jgi:hypothetical protein